MNQLFILFDAKSLRKSTLYIKWNHFRVDRQDVAVLDFRGMKRPDIVKVMI